METTNNNQDSTSSKVYKTSEARILANRRYRKRLKEKRLADKKTQKEAKRKNSWILYIKLNKSDGYRQKAIRDRRLYIKTVKNFYKFTKDTGLTYKVEILKMSKEGAKKYAELHKYNYVKC